MGTHRCQGEEQAVLSLQQCVLGIQESPADQSLKGERQWALLGKPSPFRLLATFWITGQADS